MSFRPISKTSPRSRLWSSESELPDRRTAPGLPGDAIEVNEPWDVITEVLRRDYADGWASIRPPATEDDLAAAAQAVDAALPADLARWWRRADGLDGNLGLLAPGYTPYPVRVALLSRESGLSVTADTRRAGLSEDVAARNDDPAGTACTGGWLSRWLPIANNPAGDTLFADLRPGPAHGCVGEFTPDEWSYSGPAWSSVTDMLAQTADALQHNARVRGFRVWIDEQGVHWDTDRYRWSIGGNTAFDIALLRGRYADLVAELRQGGFTSPEPGSWPADWIAAHVLRNTELLIATTEQVLADDPVGREQRRHAALQAGDGRRARELIADARRVAAAIHYDNTDAMTPATLEGYAASGLGPLAGRIEHLGAQLCDLAPGLRGGRPLAHAHIVDDGALVLDTQVGWWGTLGALTWRQLPLHIRQLQALRRTT